VFSSRLDDAPFLRLGRRLAPVPPEGCVLLATRVALGRIEEPVAPGERGLCRLIGR
jgi:hypothetical protein